MSTLVLWGEAEGHPCLRGPFLAASAPVAAVREGSLFPRRTPSFGLGTQSHSVTCPREGAVLWPPAQGSDVERRLLF